MRKNSIDFSSTYDLIHVIQGETVTNVDRARELLVVAREKGGILFTIECLSAVSKLTRDRAEADLLSIELLALQKKLVRERTMEVSDGFDAYEPQRSMPGRKSHLAAAINANIHKNPIMGVVWLIILVISVVAAFVLGMK